MESDSSIPAKEEMISIAEAAQRLGVSERTVYRLLRAGKLRRVPPGILSDKCLTDVRVYVSGEEIKGQKVRHSEENVGQLSDRVTDAVIVQMREEIRSRDEQIARMLTVQGEMTQTIQQLQTQMYELARLVLMQNAAERDAKVAHKATPPQPEQQKAQARKWNFFRRVDNRST